MVLNTGPIESRGKGKILFVVLDQLRADCVHGALAQAVDLPNMRALMAEGVCFSNHFTVTVPCGPARSSLLTGLYAMNHGSVRNSAPLSDHHTNLALEVRKSGYDPLLFGYTDTSMDPRGRHSNDPALKSYEHPMTGFTELVSMPMDSNYEWIADLKAKGYPIPPRYQDIFRAVAADGGKARLDDPTLYDADDSDTAYLTNRTLWALSVREDVDWFAHIAYFRPHPPLAAPEPYNRMYAPDDMPAAIRPDTAAEQGAIHPVFDAYFSEPITKNLYIGYDGWMARMPEADCRALRAIYFGLAAEADAHIGRLLEFLRQSGQDDDTLIVVTSDHGEMLGDHWMWGKETVFDPSYHVPLIIRDPRRRETAGQVVTALTESVDVMPTILDWIGQERPLGLDGRSLMPFLDGAPPPDWRDAVFLECDLGDVEVPTRYQRRLGLSLAQANVAILREQRFKYVHFNGGLPPLLFDLQADPGERVNLADDPAFAPEIQRLARRMIDHRMTHSGNPGRMMQLTARGVITEPGPL